jgi:hypothetical protein
MHGEKNLKKLRDLGYILIEFKKKKKITACNCLRRLFRRAE